MERYDRDRAIAKMDTLLKLIEYDIREQDCVWNDGFILTEVESIKKRIEDLIEHIDNY